MSDQTEKRIAALEAQVKALTAIIVATAADTPSWGGYKHILEHQSSKLSGAEKACFDQVMTDAEAGTQEFNRTIGLEDRKGAW